MRSLALLFILGFASACKIEYNNLANTSVTNSKVCESTPMVGSSGFQNGDGLSEATAFGICTPTQLNLIGNNSIFRDKSFKLLRSIDMSGVNFNMIANTGGDEFSGVFDGQNFSISNLTISSPINDNVAFVRANIGIIKNINLKDVNIEGANQVGGLVGENFSTITKSSVSGTVSGRGYRVGGIAGYSMGAISLSSTSITVYGHEGVGGLVGSNEGTIENSYASGEVRIHPITGCGDVYGGIVGYQDGGTISKSYAIVELDNCGTTEGFTNTNTGIAASFWNTDVYPTSVSGTGQTSSQMKDQTTYLNAGWNFSLVWKINPAENNGYPTLN